MCIRDRNPTCEVEADSVVVTYLYNLQTSPAAECSLQYRVFGDGRIQTTLHYDPVEGLAAMPEFKTIGLDAVVGSVGNGSTLRLISDIEGVKYTEGAALPCPPWWRCIPASSRSPAARS